MLPPISPCQPPASRRTPRPNGKQNRAQEGEGPGPRRPKESPKTWPKRPKRALLGPAPTSARVALPAVVGLWRDFQVVTDGPIRHQEQQHGTGQLSPCLLCLLCLLCPSVDFRVNLQLRLRPGAGSSPLLVGSPVAPAYEVTNHKLSHLLVCGVYVCVCWPESTLSASPPHLPCILCRCVAFPVRLPHLSFVSVLVIFLPLIAPAVLSPLSLFRSCSFSILLPLLFLSFPLSTSIFASHDLSTTSSFCDDRFERLESYTALPHHEIALPGPFFSTTASIQHCTAFCRFPYLRQHVSPVSCSLKRLVFLCFFVFRSNAFHRRRLSPPCFPSVSEQSRPTLTLFLRPNLEHFTASPRPQRRTSTYKDKQPTGPQPAHTLSPT